MAIAEEEAAKTEGEATTAEGEAAMAIKGEAAMKGAVVAGPTETDLAVPSGSCGHVVATMHFVARKEQVALDLG